MGAKGLKILAGDDGSGSLDPSPLHTNVFVENVDGFSFWAAKLRSSCSRFLQQCPQVVISSVTNVTNPTSDFEHPYIQEPGFLLRVALYDGIEALFDKTLISFDVDLYARVGVDDQRSGNVLKDVMT